MTDTEKALREALSEVTFSECGRFTAYSADDWISAVHPIAIRALLAEVEALRKDAERNAPSIEAARAMGEKGGEATDAERAAFEAWMAGHCWALSATWNGKEYIGAHEDAGFINPHAVRTRQLWAAWRDRAALAAQPVKR